MKPKYTMALVLVLGVLCAGYWGMVQWRKGAVQHAAEAKRLFSFEASAVKSLEIRRVGEAPSAAVRNAENGWTMQQPNPAIVPMVPVWDRVAGALAQLKSERNIQERETELGAYGLKEPALTFLAETDQGMKIQLTVGSQDPTQLYRYAQLNGKQLFLMEEKAFFELNRPLDDLRNRFLVKDREAAPVRFEFARIWTGRGKEKMDNPPAVGEESVAVVVERASKDAPWKLVAPESAQANQEAVNALVSEVYYTVGRNYIDTPESLSDYGLEPPAYRVTICDDKDRAPQTVYFGDVQVGAKAPAKTPAAGSQKPETGGLYAKCADRPAVFLVDANMLTLFPKMPDALRERRLFTHLATDIEQIEYRTPEGGGFVLVNHPEKGWRMKSPEQADTDQAAVSGYVSNLKSMEVSSFPGGDLAAHGLDQPAAVLVLTLAGQKAPMAPLEIRLKPVGPEDPFFYVTQDSGVVGMLPRMLAEQLMVGIDYFRSREIFRFAAEDAVKLDFSFEERHYVLEKVHDAWVVKQPEGMLLANQSDALSLLNALTPLISRGAVTASDLSGYGLDRPLFEVTVTLRSPDGTAPETVLGPLRVGKVTADQSQQRYASVSGRDGVFRVRQELVDTVRDMLRGIGPGRGGSR